MNNVTLYLAPAHFLKRRLVDAGFPEERIVVLPNMVRVADYGAVLRRGEYVGYSGGFMLNKGIDTLVSAARRTSLPVRLAGDYSRMPGVVKEAPPNVEFAGWLNPQQLLRFYRNARFLVVPSESYEVCPLVALEAMSNSLPVIASKVGGLPEIVDDGVTGLLFEPGNAEVLAQKMKLLWENPELCRRMGEAGREKARREYSEDVYYERLITVYRRAIALNNAGGTDQIA